ncbi:MAG TPA: hypothetical protein VML55_24185, partial [Planctomycetaceae bacterium]|nr:hypothetical protein [Planctomycetaceae bacterium]
MAAVLSILLPAVVCAQPETQSRGQAGPSGAITAARLERIGFDGYYKLGRWTPAVVSVEGGSAAAVRVIARAPDPEGCPTALPHDARIETAARRTLTVLFKNGRLGADPRFELSELDDDGNAVRTFDVSRSEGQRPRPALRQSAYLIAVIGKPAGFIEQSETGSSRAGPQPAAADERLALHVAHVSGDELPTDPAGFDALDALVVAGQYDLDEPHSDAVRAWVRLGGHLVVSVGADVESYLESRLGRWISGEPGDAAGAPIPLSGRAPVRLLELSGLESYSGQRVPIEIPRRDGVPAAVVERTAGTALVRARGDLPLVVRTAYGLGRITFIAVDFDRPPLSEWTPLAAVAQKLLGLGDGSQSAARARTGRLAHSGITDLASQLARAQRDFPAVNRSSMWTVMGLLVGYLLLIGPLDYVLVHRLL